MGLFDFIKGEFIEVIEWINNTKNTMVYKFEVPSKQQIKKGAKLIVRPSQVAIFVYEGKITDIYEPGKYVLDTDTMPVTTTLNNWKYKFENHFKTDVYFINTTRFLGQKWGTKKPITMRDQDFGMVRVRGFGVYAFKVENARKFLEEVFGTHTVYTVDTLTEHLKSIIVSNVSDVIVTSQIPAVDIPMKYEELNEMCVETISSKFDKIGIVLTDFTIENISMPEEVEKAIDKRSSMGAIGNLNTYTQYQAADAIKDAAQNEGGGFAGMGAGISVGAHMGNVMSQSLQNNQNETVTKEGVNCEKCNTFVEKGYKFCPKCGTSTVNTCNNCGTELAKDAKFCRECGQAQTTDIKCSECGATLKKDAKFCRECGNKV